MDHFYGEDGVSSASALKLVSDLVANRSMRPSATPICLLLGAGADISSGGLTFSNFKRLAIEEILGERLFQTTSDEEINERFQQIFSINHDPSDRALMIERLFRRLDQLQPSDAYKLLVMLASVDAIDAVVTTNFDHMLETADKIVGCEAFQVFAEGVARPYPSRDIPSSRGKKPYIKLHGDLASRSVSYLTENELESGNYDTSILDLLSYVLKTHDLIIAGYSGFDPALARIIIDAVEGVKHHIFWCSPTPPSEQSKLYVSIRDRCRLIIAPFDELMARIAKPVLEKPRFASSKPTYIRCLFDWRIEHCNQTYIRNYSLRNSRATDLIVRRPLLERTINSFLSSAQPLAIIAGPSGFGKTTLGIRLHESWRENSSRRVILLTSKSLSSPEIELHLAERLGGLGPPVPLSLASLETWLREERLQLIIFVDALNEYSTNLSDCVQLARNIIRLCYYLPEHASTIKMIVTIRQETWSLMIDKLDSGALRQSLWSASGIVDTLDPVTIGPLSNDELQEALDRIRAVQRLDLRMEDLSPVAIERLRDPFLLSAIAASGGLSSLSGPTSSIYKLVYNSLLLNSGAEVDPATLQDVLAHLALQTIQSGNDKFRQVDMVPATLRATLLRASKDLGILQETADGYLSFRHDRLQEYFLSIGLSLADAPPLGTLEQLRDYLIATRHNAKARAAARMFFTDESGSRFRLIEEAMLVTRGREDGLTDADRGMIFSFAREVVYELTESDPSLAARYIRTGIRAASNGEVDSAHLRTLVQSASGLPDDLSIPALSLVNRVGNDLATTEADIYIVDKLLRRYLQSGCPKISFLETMPYHIYFDAKDISPWRQVGRVLRLLGRAGSDNLHYQEYSAVMSAVRPALEEFAKRQWTNEDINNLADYCISNSDRLLFNATPEDFADFYSNPERYKLARVLGDLEAHRPLRHDHLQILNPYIQSMDFSIKPQNLEFNVCTLFFMLSAVNDLEATFTIWEEQFSTFNDYSSASEVDFYQGVLVYLHTLFAIPYDLRFAEYEERILRDWPTILKCRPGLTRGQRRGFKDEFDMIFEDGFGVIYPYGVLLSARTRRQSSYIDYKRNLALSLSSHPLPLYSKYLKLFLNSGRVDEVVQIIQGLNEVIVGWPAEGLATLRDAIGYSHPTVHRAVVRVLSEAYHRHPGETVRFLQASGSALSEEDLQEIKIRQDPRIGRRQVSQQEWGRIAAYALRDKAPISKLINYIRIMIESDDFRTAVHRIAKSLGLQSIRL